MNPDATVFLVDVDNTLLDNDLVQDDIRRHLEREYGVGARDRYWGARTGCRAAEPLRAERPLRVGDLLALL